MAVETKQRTITVMDPRASALEAHTTMAPRLPSLDGKVLGLLDNSKANADNLLRLMADLLKERFELKDVKFARKPDASRPVPVETVEELAKHSDFAIVAVGD